MSECKKAHHDGTKAEGTDIREMTDNSQRAVVKLELGAHKAFT